MDYWVAPALNANKHASVTEEAIAMIEATTQQPLTTKGRRRLLCEGRQLAAYIMRVKYGISLYSVGERLNIDHSTVSYAVKTIATFLKIDKRFVSRWKPVIDFADLETDIPDADLLHKPGDDDMPSCCGQCSGYIIREHFCGVRMVRCFDNKPISKDCFNYNIKKRL